MTDFWKDYAVLLIDFQKTFYANETRALFPELPGNVERLLATCRGVGIDVIHIRSRFREDRSDWMPKYRVGNSIPCIEGSEGGETLVFAEEREGESVLFKKTFDAFLLPDTVDLIRQMEKRFVLTAGLVTETCLFHSTVSSSQLFLTAVIEDCCASPDNHEDALDRLDFYVVGRTRSDRIVEDCEKWRELI